VADAQLIKLILSASQTRRSVHWRSRSSSRRGPWWRPVPSCGRRRASSRSPRQAPGSCGKDCVFEKEQDFPIDITYRWQAAYTSGTMIPMCPKPRGSVLPVW